jgi:hypothetical protein
MKIYFTDETNTSQNPDQGFFIYGGIVVDESELRPLSIGILSIKEKLGIPKERPIKWPNTKWKQCGKLDPILHANVKEEILSLFTKSSSKIIICLSPQNFYHKPKIIPIGLRYVIDEDKQKQAQEYALNVSLSKFDQYLRSLGCIGIVMADEFADNLKAHLSAHCFKIFPDGTDNRYYENVVYPVIQLNNEYSQIHQINDVVLGAISHSLMELANNFLPRLASQFWSSDPNDKSTILRYGFNVYPINPRTQELVVDLQHVKSKFMRRLQ